MTVAHRLKQTLLEMEMLSQVPAAQLERQSPSATTSIGGNRPLGGSDYASDSLERFQRRIRTARTPRDLEAILDDALVALSAWKEPRKWKPGDPDLEFGSTQWKRYIAESKESGGVLATKWGCTRQYIHQVRKQYAA